MSSIRCEYDRFSPSLLTVNGTSVATMTYDKDGEYVRYTHAKGQSESYEKYYDKYQEAAKKISELEAQLAAKNEQIEALQKDRDFIKGKFDRAMDAARRTINRLNEEVADLSLKTFRRFNEEECWIYQGDDSDNLHSLVCPVVISAKDLMALQSSKASVDEIKHIQERVCNVISSVRWGWDGDCGCEREVDNWFDRYLSEQKAD